MYTLTPTFTALGDLKKKRTADPSIVVVRRNESIGGTETYLPPRLLQGLLPSVLLESFEFWQGEDMKIRASPREPGLQWFNFNLEVTVEEGDGVSRKANILRRAADRALTKVYYRG